MKRESLLTRLVDRKMSDAARNKAICFCVCLARKSDAQQRLACANPKK